MYNCSLALYYLLVLRFNWTNERLAKIERYVHGFIITFTVGTSIAGLPLTMYNKVTTVCWVIGYPADCGNSSSSFSDTPCERGNWAWLFGIILFYGPLWICVMLTIIAMILIYIQVRNTFKKNERYLFQRRPSVITSVRPGNGEGGGPAVAGVRANGDTMDSSRRNGNMNSHGTAVDAAGQTSSRMSRISVFRTKRPDVKELEELAAALEREDAEAEERDGNHTDDADEEKIVDEIDEEPAELPHVARNAYTLADSEVSGGIGLKSGWMQATAANHASTTSTTTNGNGNGRIPADETRSRFSTAVRRRSTRESRTKRKQSMFATQAILYSGSFFITWTPSTIWSVAYWFGVGGIGFDLAAASCEPLQGFWNMLIFIRSRPESQEKLRRVFGSFCCFWVNMLPKMHDSLDRSSSMFSRRMGESSAVSDRDGTKRQRSSNIQNSVGVMSAASEPNNSDTDAFHDQERSVQFTTEPTSGDEQSS